MIPSDSLFIFSKREIKLKEVKVEVKSYLETHWQNWDEWETSGSTQHFLPLSDLFQWNKVLKKSHKTLLSIFCEQDLIC